MKFLQVLTALVFFAGYSLLNDQKLRDELYTKPLANMPTNARELFEQMLQAAISGAEKTDEEIQKIRIEILTILAQGAVAQRNHEMERVRGEISTLGYMLSWFLKQKGLSYAEIAKKFETEVSSDEQQKCLKIIDSASRSNPSVFNKLLGKLASGLGIGVPKL